MWQNKVLWFLGFLTSINGSVSSLLQAWASAALAKGLASGELFDTQFGRLQSLTDTEMAALSRLLIGGVFVSFLLSLLVWLVVTLAEGAQISSVIHLNAGAPISLRAAVGISWRFMVRFAGVDTLVFFPLFALVLFLTVLMTAMAVTLGALYLSGQLTGLSLPTLLLSAACVIPLLLLVLFAGLLTPLFRSLAFRAIVSRSAGVKQSVRHTWLIVRRHTGTILLIATLLWVIRYLSGFFLSILTVPLISLSGFSFLRADLIELETMLPMSQGGWILSGLLLMPTVSVHLFSSALTHTVWTLAYLEKLDLGLTTPTQASA